MAGRRKNRKACSMKLPEVDKKQKTRQKISEQVS